MSRWKASAIHLLLSALIVGSIAVCVVTLWYPLSMLHVTGIDRLIGLIALVDLTVGPLLTLIIYKQGKRGLKLDLTLIGIVQLSLLLYGLYALAQNRPVFMVAAVDRFELVAAREIADEDLALGKPPFDRLSWSGAVTVGVEMPADNTELIDASLSGRDVQVQPKYYVPFDQARAQLIERARPLERLRVLLNDDERALLAEAIGDRAPDSLRFLPMNTAAQSATVLVDAVTAEPFAVLAIDPW